MKIWVCGVRGSTPAPGPDHAGVGGCTSCVALGSIGGAPRLVLDAGTGIRNLTAVLDGEPFRGTILLGHLHWDHTTGLPFFAAGDRDDAVVALRLPEQGVDAEELLGRAMAPPHFPITPAELRGRWSFSSIDEGTESVEGFEVLVREIPHKGGRTLGFRISDPDGGSVAYLSDHGPVALGPGDDGLGELHPAALELARDVDVLFHDAQYTCAELPGRATWGHSAADYAARLGAEAGARRVLLYHHDPSRTDDQVEQVLSEVRASHPRTRVDAAVEGMVIEL